MSKPPRGHEPPSRTVQRYLSTNDADRSLGQNFLIDSLPISKSLEFSESMGLCNQSTVLEIGPGPGTLTSAVLAIGAKVIAIEISPDALDFLESEISDPHLSLVNGDALDVRWPDGLTHVIANIPYGISSPLLAKIQDYHQNSPLRGVCVLVQREFGNRMVMKTPPKDRGPLGISLWLDFDCTVVLDVPRSSFRPQPEVDSSVIGMKPVSRGHISEEERVRIRALSSWCFGRRRKKIRTSLKSTPNPVQRVLGISRLEWDHRVESLERLSGAFSDLIQRRPEELEPESWVKLSRMIVEELDLPE